MNFTQMIYNLDLFGRPPSLRVLKKNRYTSKLGLILSLFLLTTVLTYSIYLILILKNQSEPFVISSQYQLVDTLAYPLQRNNYTLAISLVDKKLENSIQLGKHANLIAQQCSRLRISDNLTGKVTVKSECTDIPLESCTMEHFLSDTQIEYFSKIRLGTVQCFQKEFWDSNPPILQSYVQGQHYYYMQIFLKACQNSTDYNECAPQEEINVKLKSGLFIVHQSDYLFNLENPEQPVQEMITLQHYQFSIGNSKFVDSYLQLQTVRTDIGLIAKQYQLQTGLPQYTFRETQDIYNEQYIIQFSLKFDNKITIFQRQYIKLQTMLGNIGGLYSVIYIIFALFMSKYQEISLSMEIASKLFKFEQEKEQERTNNLLVNFSQSKSGEMNFDDKQKQEIKRYLNNENNDFKLKFKDIIFQLLGIKTEFLKRIHYASQKILSKIDIANLISKTFEIDKLKFILLNEEQQKLFNYIPKPTIPLELFHKDNCQQHRIADLEQEIAYRYILQEEKSQLDKIQEAFSSYQSIIQKSKKTRIDQQILSFLDKDILELFRYVSKDKSNILKFQSSFRSPQFSIKQPSPYQSSDQSANRVLGDSVIEQIEYRTISLNINSPHIIQDQDQAEQEPVIQKIK